VREANKSRDYKTSSKGFSKYPSVTSMGTDSRVPVPSKLEVSIPQVPTKSHSTEDKLATLYAYMKAKGLCYKCGLTYARCHKCVETVQLHLVEELWQFMNFSDDEDQSVDQAPEELHMLNISQAAISGTDSLNTIRFLGHIAGMEILVLLDSGSSASFISDHVAAHLPHVQAMAKPLLVHIANGSSLSCDKEVLQVTWYLNEYMFTSDLKVLQISSYDLILGMDWLGTFSPMWVHWAAKWLVIPYGGSSLKLWGLGAQEAQCAVLEVCPLDILPAKDQSIVLQLPLELQHLLASFADIFEVPQSLPPSRDCDHHIPLIAGARPVQM
jgi:hypothetical protein